MKQYTLIFLQSVLGFNAEVDSTFACLKLKQQKHIFIGSMKLLLSTQLLHYETFIFQMYSNVAF